jgi:hypothetical protein
MNLFTVPKVKEEKKEGSETVSLDDVEKMSTEEFTSLGEEKISAFPESQQRTRQVYGQRGY